MRKLFSLLAIVMMAVTMAHAANVTVNVNNIPAKYEGWTVYSDVCDIKTSIDTSYAKSYLLDFRASLAMSAAYKGGRISEETWVAYYKYIATEYADKLDTVVNGSVSFTGTNTFSYEKLAICVTLFDSIVAGGHYESFIFNEAPVVDGTVTLDMTGAPVAFQGTLHTDEQESALNDVESNNRSARKILENGRIVILKGEDKFDVCGTKIE